MNKATANVEIEISVSLEDEFLKYEPRTETERLFKELLIDAINGEQKTQPVVCWDRQHFEEHQRFMRQRTLLLGNLIKKMVEEGTSIEKAWDMVCNDHTVTENFFNAKPNANP